MPVWTLGAWFGSLVGCLLSCSCLADACIDLDPDRFWNRDELYRVPGWRANPFPESDYPGMRAMLVKGKGLPNESGEFFVYFATPEGNVPEGGWPAILIVHGAGGTAYPNVVEECRKEGFAVMALDWYNQRPAPGLTNVAPSEVTVPRVDLPGGKHGYEHLVNVANVVTAHSLLRSLPDVNPKRTCLAGLSWGSWYASVAGAVDDRFCGVISIYIADRRPYAGTSPKDDAFVKGPFHKSFKNPVWWIVWPPDGNYICSSMQAGWEVCPKDAGRTIIHNLDHSHEGFSVAAVKRMAKYFTGSAPRLPLLSLGSCKDGVARAEILDPGKGVDHALLWCYDRLPDYGWEKNKDLVGYSVPAEIVGREVRAKVPAKAKLCYLSVYEKDQPDEKRNVMCGSSGYFEVDGK